eukprot:15339623-Ditylum_brightwellii.AAC.1
MVFFLQTKETFQGNLMPQDMRQITWSKTKIWNQQGHLQIKNLPSNQPFQICNKIKQFRDG